MKKQRFIKSWGQFYYLHESVKKCVALCKFKFVWTFFLMSDFKKYLTCYKQTHFKILCCKICIHGIYTFVHFHYPRILSVVSLVSIFYWTRWHCTIYVPVIGRQNSHHFSGISQLNVGEDLEPDNEPADCHTLDFMDFYYMISFNMGLKSTFTLNL